MVGANSWSLANGLKSTNSSRGDIFRLPGVEMPHRLASVTATSIALWAKEMSACKGVQVNVSYLNVSDFSRRTPCTGMPHKFISGPASSPLSFSRIFSSWSHSRPSAEMSISSTNPAAETFTPPLRIRRLSAKMKTAGSTLTLFFVASKETLSIFSGTPSFHGKIRSWPVSIPWAVDLVGWSIKIWARKSPFIQPWLR